MAPGRFHIRHSFRPHLRQKRSSAATFAPQAGQKASAPSAAARGSGSSPSSVMSKREKRRLAVAL